VVHGLTAVMPALVAGIHAFLFVQDVDGRDKPGHDGLGMSDAHVR
jgi:2-oxoglutarate ferredoxin oxidoreductase subunit beta